MKEGKFDIYDINFLANFVKQIDCRPPNQTAYVALCESIKIERGITSGEITALDFIDDEDWKIIKKGFTCDDKNPDVDELYYESLTVLNSYICNKYGVTHDDLDEALDWQSQKIALLYSMNILN